MKKIAVRDFRANLKETSDAIIEGEVFYLNPTDDDSPKVVLSSDKTIDRFILQKEYYTRYFELLHSWNLHGSGLVPLFTSEKSEIDEQIKHVQRFISDKSDAKIVTHGYRLALNYLYLIKHFNIGVIIDPSEFNHSQELITFLELLGIERSEKSIVYGALYDLSIVEYNHIQNGALDKYSAVIQDFIIAIGHLAQRTLITFRPENTILAMEDALNPLLEWYETHISKVRMQTKRIDGVWKHVPCAKGDWGFIPAKGEEKYAIK